MKNSPVKIVIICGSLEPGHDGVGDYTRALAAALTKAEIAVKIIAVMDRNVSGIVTQTQDYRGTAVSTLRLSGRLPLKERKKNYKLLLSEFKPHWLSLQFVPYAFSKRGIPFWLVAFLGIHSKQVKWHIMFHESYIGANMGLKDKFVQMSQIFIIKQLVSKLKPAVVHTSTLAYQERITKIGIDTSLLGLFGNIPVPDKLPKPKRFDDKLIRGVYFGSAPKISEFSNFSKAINSFMTRHKIRLEIIFCGGIGVNGAKFLSFLKNATHDKPFVVVEAGRLNEEELSTLFLECDFGMARVPPFLIGKSGSAIAMLEHGLPLWIPLAENQDEIEKNCDFRKDQCFAILTAKAIENKQFIPKSRLAEVLRTFTEDLSINREHI